MGVDSGQVPKRSRYRSQRGLGSGPKEESGPAHYGSITYLATNCCPYLEFQIFPDKGLLTQFNCNGPMNYL